jgi:predicted small lipoprotein YifL
MQTIRTILMILISTVVLSACGLRGPLYLPEEDPATTPGVEQETNGSEDKKEDKKEDQEKESDPG